MLNGKCLNGSMLLELCRSYVGAINEGKVPCIENAWSYVIKHECEKNIRKMIYDYKKTMTKILPLKSDNYCENLLKSISDIILADLMSKFKNETILEKSEEYEVYANKIINEVFQYHLKD